MLIEAFGTCFRRRGAGSGVESFEESSRMVILLRMRPRDSYRLMPFAELFSYGVHISVAVRLALLRVSGVG